MGGGSGSNQIIDFGGYKSIEEIQLASKDPKKVAEIADIELQKVKKEQEKKIQNKIFESDEHLKEKNITVDEYIQLKNPPQMIFPTQTNSTLYIGSRGNSTGEETATLNKGNTYNRNSKRGTRLVWSR